MSWIFVTSEEFEDTPMIISVDTISMVARGQDGGATIFFVEPERRVLVSTSYEDILAQLSNIKSLAVNSDSAYFSDLASGQTIEE